MSEGARPSGVNFVGDWLLDTGMGTASRSMMRSCLDASIPVAIVPWHSEGNPVLRASETGLPELPIGSQYPINILSHNIHLVAGTTPDDVHRATKGKYSIGNWYWELSSLPEGFKPGFDRVDEVWVSSQFVRDCFRTATDKPITVVPPSVTVRPSGKFGRMHFGLEEGRFTFLFSFSVASCGTRKNPWAVLDAYEKAFQGAKPALVLKVTNAAQHPEFERELRQRCAVTGAMLLDRNLTREEMEDLLGCADAYISLHRSEGFGLGMAEAMVLGKPVIGTAYSGNVDFMNAENSYPVGFRLTTVGETDFRGDGSFRQIFSDPNAVWAEADVAAAAAAMRSIVEDPDEAARRGRNAAAFMASFCSSESVGRQIAVRLVEIERDSLASGKKGSSPYVKARIEAILREMEANNLQTEESLRAWEQTRRRDIEVSGKIPVLSGLLRILIRPLLLGKLNDRQSELNQNQLRHQQAVEQVIREIKKEL